jgi:hypothetical protein
MFSITDPDPYDAKQVGGIKKNCLPFFPLSQNMHGFRILPAIVCSVEIKLCIVLNWLDRILTAGNRFFDIFASFIVSTCLICYTNLRNAIKTGTAVMELVD